MLANVRSAPPRKRRVRGHIEQLPSGSYRAIVYAGTDPLIEKERRLQFVRAPEPVAASQDDLRLEHPAIPRRIGLRSSCG